MRTLVNAPTVLTSTWYAPSSETPVDVDATVTVTVTHANGTILLNGATMAHGATGVYTVTLPPQPDPFDATAVYTATLSGLVTKQTEYIQGVGAFFATLAEIRGLDALLSATTFPTTTLIAKRDAAETLFETATGRHWTAKYGREVLDGDPSYRRAMMSVYGISSYQGLYNLTRRLALGQVRPRRLLAVYIDDGSGRTVLDGVTASSTTVTSATANFLASDVGKGISGGTIPTGTTISSVTNSITVVVSNAATGSASGVTLVVSGLAAQPDLNLFKLYDSGEIERTLSSVAWPRGVENVVIEYVYGEDAPPADLKGAFLQYVRYLLLEASGRIPDRATSMQTDFGSFTIGQASGWLKPTGLSEVDAVLQRYGYRLPVIA